jgi:hypothetical protein
MPLTVHSYAPQSKSVSFGKELISIANRLFCSQGRQQRIDRATGSTSLLLATGNGTARAVGRQRHLTASQRFLISDGALS